MTRFLTRSLILVGLLVLIMANMAIAAPIVMRTATVHPDSHPFTIGLRFFADRVNQLTNGAIKVEVYPASQLGNERDLAEGVQIGTVDLAVVTTAVISGFEPRFQIFSLPFLFENEDELYRITDGPFGDKYAAFLHQQGMDLWGYWVVGGRGLYSKRPVRTVEDVKGMKIRTLESPVVVDTWKALGALPTPIPWSEVYTAIQTGLVDGAEGSMLGLVTAKHGELVDYFTDLQYIISGNVVVVSQAFLGRLDATTEANLEKAMDETTQKVRDLFRKQNDEIATKVKTEYGVTIIQPNVAPFQEKVKFLYEKYGEIDQEDINYVLTN